MTGETRQLCRGIPAKRAKWAMPWRMLSMQQQKIRQTISHRRLYSRRDSNSQRHLINMELVVSWAQHSNNIHHRRRLFLKPPQNTVRLESTIRLLIQTSLQMPKTLQKLKLRQVVKLWNRWPKCAQCKTYVRSRQHSRFSRASQLQGSNLLR